MIVHEIVGLMYELCFAMRTTTILDQELVWLATHRVFAFRTYIVTLELTSQIKTFLGNLRRVKICFDKEDD